MGGNFVWFLEEPHPLPSTESETSSCFLPKLEADSNLGCPKHVSKVVSTTPKPYEEFIAPVGPFCCIGCIHQLVGCYSSLAGTHLEAVLPPVVTSDSISLREWCPYSKETTCRLWSSVCRNSAWFYPGGATEHSAALGANQNTQSSILFAGSLVAEPEPGKSVGWGRMRLHREKGLCSVPTALGDKTKMGYILRC